MNVNPYNKQQEKVEKLQTTKQRDQIEISAEALELQKGDQFEIERQQKVAEIKNKVDSGEYQINPKEVAHKLYSFWDDLKK
jgi:negative regulator of flagellin synthesis FlgM